MFCMLLLTSNMMMKIRSSSYTIGTRRRSGLSRIDISNLCYNSLHHINSPNASMLSIVISSLSYSSTSKRKPASTRKDRLAKLNEKVAPIIKQKLNVDISIDDYIDTSNFPVPLPPKIPKSIRNQKSLSAEDEQLMEEFGAVFESSQVDDLYKELSRPVSNLSESGLLLLNSSNLASSPLLATASKLDPDYLESLKVKFLDTAQSAEKAAQESLKLLQSETEPIQIQLNALSSSPTSQPSTTISDNSIIPFDAPPPTVATLTVDDINKVIQVNALLNRPEAAQAAFDLISALPNAPTPNLDSFNHLLHAYAASGNLRKAAKVFKALKEAPATSPTNTTTSTPSPPTTESTESPSTSTPPTKYLTPNLESYTHLIQASINAKDMTSAFKVYTALRTASKSNKDLLPPLSIYTLLIQGCLLTRDIERAWKTFDHVRTELYAPDAFLYTTMIGACELTQDAERALDLFTEMVKEKGLAASERTYANLILACGSRQDYVREAYELYDQMQKVEGYQQGGMEMTKVMLKVAGNSGDLVGARIFWNQLIDRCERSITSTETLQHQGSLGMLDEDAEAEGELPPVSLDNEVFAVMLRALAKSAKATKRAKSANAKSTAAAATAESHDPDLLDDSAQMNSSNPLPSSQPPPPSTSTATTSTTHRKDDVESSIPTTTTTNAVTFPKGPLHHLRMNPTDLSAVSIMNNADQLWNYLTTNTTTPITSDLVDQYLSVMCSMPGNAKAISRAVNVFVEYYINDDATTSNQNQLPSPPPTENASTGSSQPTVSLPETDSPATTTTTSTTALEITSSLPPPPPTKVPRTGASYSLMLSLASKDKKLMLARGTQVWESLLAWDARMEEAMMQSKQQPQQSLTNLTLHERELVRESQGRGKGEMWQNFVCAAQGFARINNLPAAFNVLSQMQTYRDHYYLPAVHFKDVPTLVDKVRDHAENGDLDMVRKLKQVLPPPPAETPYEEVKRILKDKWLGRNWWGWEALGVDEGVRRRIMRRQEKKRERAQMHWDEKRRK